MVCGYGDQVAYGELVQNICKVHIDKSSRFTDWGRRPLTDAQVNYAIADVTHLRDVYRVLRAKLEEAGPALLARRRTERSLLAIDLRAASGERLGALPQPGAQAARSRRADGSRGLARGGGAEPRRAALAHPQGRRARSRSRWPRRKTPEALAELRAVPRGMERTKAGADIIEAVQRGLARDPKTLPRHRARTPQRIGRRRHRGTAQGAAAAGGGGARRRGQDDRDRRRPRGPRAMRRRRRSRPSKAGGAASSAQRALELKQGRLALTVENGKVTLLEWQDAPAPSA